jgi:hypothetical protein
MHEQIFFLFRRYNGLEIDYDKFFRERNDKPFCLLFYLSASFYWIKETN